VKELAMEEKKEIRGAGSPSFLLAQLGSHAATKFAQKLQPLGFAPQHAGILRMIAYSPGISQQDLASALNMHASRLVSVLDELQTRGFLERRPSERDRRLYALHLTPNGEQGLVQIGHAAREHNHDLMSGLSAEQQKQLTDLLEILVQHQGLSRGVHPGYRRLHNGKSIEPKETES
jgi:DNA-binding MarR family transcriptional regulator